MSDWIGVARELFDGACVWLEDEVQVRQSIHDLLTTPKGSRVMRPEYGTRLPEMIDRPVSPSFLVDLYAEIAQAIARFEPRVRLKRCQVVEVLAGGVTIELALVYQGRELRVQVVGGG